MPCRPCNAGWGPDWFGILNKGQNCISHGQIVHIFHNVHNVHNAQLSFGVRGNIGFLSSKNKREAIANFSDPVNILIWE